MTIDQLVYYEQLAESAFIDIRQDYMDENSWPESTEYMVQWWMIEINKKLEQLNSQVWELTKTKEELL